MSIIYARPKCPDHPESHVVNAKSAHTGGRVWCCLACGKNLGEAPPYEPQWEPMIIEGRKK